MNAKRLRIAVSGSRGLMGIAAAGLIAISALAIGCSGTDSDADSTSLGLTSPEATEATTRPAPPTLGELLAKVDLTPSQMQPMEDALARWTAAGQARMEQRRTNRDRGSRGDREKAGRFVDHERPLLGFLEESAQILKPDQFADLTEFLADRRAAHQEARIAHRGDRARKFRDHMFERLGDELNLSEDQQAAIRDIRQQSREAMRALRAEFEADNQDTDALREKAKEIRAQSKEQIESILTPEQLTRMKELREQRRSAMAERRQANLGQRIERHTEFLARILNLSDAQKQQISEILTTTREQRKTLHEGIRNEDIAFKGGRGEGSRIKEETNTAIKDMLTPEQTEMFDALKKLFPDHRRARHGRPMRRH